MSKKTSRYSGNKHSPSKSFSAGPTERAGKRFFDKKPSTQTKASGNDSPDIWFGRHAVEQILTNVISQGKNITGRLLISRKDQKDDPDWENLCRQAGILSEKTEFSQLSQMAGHDGHQGILLNSIFKMPVLEKDELFESQSGLFIALEELEDPGNVGAIARTSLGLGVRGLVFTRHRSAALGATAMKASSGALAWLPVLTVGGIPGLLLELSRKNPDTIILGADINAPDVEEILSRYNLHAGSPPVILVLGSEGHGLSRLTTERCTETVSLPQNGPITSYNVAASAAMLAYTISRRLIS